MIDSESSQSAVGAYTCMTVKFMGWDLNLADMILELTGLKPSSAFLAVLFSRRPTPIRCNLSSPDHKKWPPSASPFPVHRTSDSPIISHLYLFSSCFRSSSLPLSRRVRTFQVPRMTSVRATFNDSVQWLTFRPSPGSSAGDAGLGDPGDVRSGVWILMWTFLIDFIGNCSYGHSISTLCPALLLFQPAWDRLRQRTHTCKHPNPGLLYLSH